MSKLISKDDFIKLFDNYDITISDSEIGINHHRSRIIYSCLVLFGYNLYKQ